MCYVLAVVCGYPLAMSLRCKFFWGGFRVKGSGFGVRVEAPCLRGLRVYGVGIGFRVGLEVFGVSPYVKQMSPP